MICFYVPNFSAPLRPSLLFFLVNRETRPDSARSGGIVRSR